MMKYLVTLIIFTVNLLFSQNVIKLLPNNDEIKGWKKSGDYRIFEGEKLYEYIDGAAETYHPYGFIKVITQDYKNGDKQIVVDIYEFSNSKNTFGIYSIERDPKYNFINIGNQGYFEGTTLNFWKGNYYVKLVSFSKGKYKEDLQSFAKIIDTKITSKDKLPVILSFFPNENLIKNSEKYFTKDMLGHRFFYNGYTAEYTDGKDNYKIFILDAGNQKNAQNLFVSYKNYINQSKGFNKEIDNLGLGAFTGKAIGKKVFAFYNKKIMAGVIGLNDDNKALRILKELNNK